MSHDHSARPADAAAPAATAQRTPVRDTTPDFGTARAATTADSGTTGGESRPYGVPQSDGTPRSYADARTLTRGEVHDPAGRFTDAQRETAGVLADCGVTVHAAPEGYGADALLQWQPDAPARPATFRRVEPGVPGGPDPVDSIATMITNDSPVYQLANVDLVIDGRDAGLDRYRAAAQHNAAADRVVASGGTHHDRVHFLVNVPAEMPSHDATVAVVSRTWDDANPIGAGYRPGQMPDYGRG